MSSVYGEHLKLSIFGQSHGSAIGMTLDGVPAGLSVDLEALNVFMQRRAPGKQAYSTPRAEADCPEFLSGIVNGYTCGAPIAAVIQNTNTKSRDYSNLYDCPRPGHADYTAQVKYKGYQDVAGGGHFSGRLTAPLCIAGGLCIQWLKQRGITVTGHICSIAGISDMPARIDPVRPQLQFSDPDFPVFSAQAAEKMKKAISDAKADGDSVGGVIECVIEGVPAGLGGPLFGGLEGKIAQSLYAIPAVKAVDFGAGFDACGMPGSQHNDAFTIENSTVRTVTNNAGGILGGISSGMPIIFRVGIKPTPSIAKLQQSISLSSMEEKSLTVEGRHDPCIVPRAVPVVEAAAAIAIFDALLSNY